jgi:hypothetical protein
LLVLLYQAVDPARNEQRERALLRYALTESPISQFAKWRDDQDVVHRYQHSGFDKCHDVSGDGVLRDLCQFELYDIEPVANAR